MISLSELNQLTPPVALEWFMQTCTAQAWCEIMVAKRPYSSTAELRKIALSEWEGMQKEDFLEAFAGHPMIGDVNSLRKKYANTKALASNEQSGVKEATEEVLNKLSKANRAYLERHGFIFIICATGLSADQMLLALESRIHNSTEQEIANAAKEQIKITLLRFDKALSE